MLKRLPDVMFGAVLAMAILATGILIGSSQHQPSDQPAKPATEYVQAAHKPDPFTWDWFTHDGVVFFTAALTLVAGIQAGLFIWQLSYMRRGMKDATIAANAAMLSARAAIAIELPIIQADPEGWASGRTRNGDGAFVDYIYLFKIDFHNVGRTKAFPIEVHCGWTFGDRLPEMPVYTFRKTFHVGTILEPDGAALQDIYIHDSSVSVPPDWFDQIRSGKSAVWFYCSVVYLDFMQERHETGFCWKRYEVFGKGGFRQDPAPAYNRKT